MLRIRKEQMAAFQSMRDEVFARWLATYLRTHYSGLLGALSDADLERRVLVGLARALGHGLRDERKLAQFIILMFQHAPNFDEHEHIRARLSEGGRSAEWRFSEMVARTTQEEWAEVRYARDDATWGTSMEPSIQ
ncbi:hypothetical protein [Vitiosangium sp. GDMCC 1.1324]|uniref:hypothetical protein n=1 Tax=Vitiosangium sp. (strain GDMCC 1.1324) TaxID=2138576 RepID=UPI000D3D9024|nr:hypothetical protein [Vitiosangium sp. GDMCC 1.1324]PTL80310.1 hypothetical protein DAT35_30465 [Vitiosangium sp. GDMCC 1.1324]